MFGFSKKDKNPSIAGKNHGTEIEIEPKVSEQIHVMPQRFYVVQKKKRGGLVLIIVLGLLILAGLSVGAYYINESLKDGQKKPLNTNTQTKNLNINQPKNQNINTNQPAENINTNQSANANQNTNENFNVNGNINQNINVNANLNTNQPTNLNQNFSSPLPLAPDTDNDGLTDVEEALFGTNPNSSDSDNDIYSDGSELLSGYDPTKPQTTLADSSLFKTYNHQNYSIIYPDGFQLKELGESEVIFQAPNGEFVEVIVILNSDKLNLLDWYQKQQPAEDPNLLTSLTVNNLLGLRSADQLTYYLAAPNLSQIYLVTYNVGNLNQTNFMTTFQVMVKSFKTTP